jgi:hypothetical protein
LSVWGELARAGFQTCSYKLIRRWNRNLDDWDKKPRKKTGT